MTEVTTQPEAAPQAAPAPPVEKRPEPTPAPETPAVEHTAGGWPVVPLALTGTNSVVGAVASASLAAGPVGGVAAAAGALLVGGIAAARTNQKNPKNKAATRRTTTRAGTPTRTTGHGSRAGSRSSGAGNGSAQSRGAGRRGSGSTATGARGRKSPGQRWGSAAGRSATGSVGKTRSGAAGGKHGNAASRTALGAGRRGVTGPVGQVRALRRAQGEQTSSRGAARRETTQARRGVADARRAAKTAARTNTAASRGLAGRAAAKGAGWAGRARDAAVRRSRAARDRRTQDRVDRARDGVRKAPARRRARTALWRSAARLHGRRLLAAALSAPLGLLGALTTPLGRALGWRWLQHPGRRLYRRLMASAHQDRAERDAQIREQLADDEAAADAAAEADPAEIGDRAERPTHLIPRPTPSDQEVTDVSGFKFAEAAAEMEQAASTYDPDGMEILAMVRGLPEALQSVANTFRILAERSDSEFPLEKDVANGFDDIWDALIKSVQAAEDLVPLFEQVHEKDIARHEDPRNGSEAEKKWNV